MICWLVLQHQCSFPATILANKKIVDDEHALHSVLSAVCALVGHIKTLNCLTVSDAADREGGLNHSIDAHTKFTVQASNVDIHRPTVQLSTHRLGTNRFITCKIP